MKTTSRASSITRRSLLKASAAGAAIAGFPAPLIAQTKPFAGVTLHGASFQHRFFTLLQKYIPEFEDKTGMKVDLQLSALPVYNQQANLELSSGGSAYDVVNVTFTLATRWIAAGLLANLDEFTGDANLTPAEWNPKDFVDGAQVPYRDAKGATYGYSWEGGAMLMGLSRMDLMEKKGLKIPKPSPSCSRSAPRSTAPRASAAWCRGSCTTGICRPTSRASAATSSKIRPAIRCRR